MSADHWTGVFVVVAGLAALWARYERRRRVRAEGDRDAARVESEGRWRAAEAWRERAVGQARENQVLETRLRKLTTPPPGVGPPS